MKLGNFIRHWVAYGEGWRIEVRLEATDDAAYQRAKNQLRMLTATFNEAPVEFWQEPD